MVDDEILALQSYNFGDIILHIIIKVSCHTEVSSIFPSFIFLCARLTSHSLSPSFLTAPLFPPSRPVPRPSRFSYALTIFPTRCGTILQDPSPGAFPNSTSFHPFRPSTLPLSKRYRPVGRFNSHPSMIYRQPPLV